MHLCYFTTFSQVNVNSETNHVDSFMVTHLCLELTKVFLFDQISFKVLVHKPSKTSCTLYFLKRLYLIHVFGIGACWAEEQQSNCPILAQK